MSANYNDGRIVCGSQKVLVTPPTGSTGWTAANFVLKSLNLPLYGAKRQTGTDEVGNEDTQWFTGTIPDSTAVLQFPSKTQLAPPQYSTFPAVPRNSSTPMTFIIYELIQVFEAGGETLMQCKIAQEQAAAVAPTDPNPGQ